jgi:serine/threonine-protein kinase
MVTTQAPREIPIDPGLRAVIWRCLEKDRNARFADVAELAAALVPFGGPLSRAYAALVRTPAATHVTGPRVPVVALHTPTVASIARDSSTVASIARPVATNPPVTQRRATPGARSLWIAIPIGVVLLGGAAAIGYFARGSDDHREPAAGVPVAPPDAAPGAVAASPPDAAPRADAASPPDAAPRAVAASPPDAAETKPQVRTVRGPLADMPAQHRAFEEALANAEQSIRQSQDRPQYLPPLYMAAVSMACIVGDLDKARAYLSKLTDPKLRAEALGNCGQYDIHLE